MAKYKKGDMVKDEKTGTVLEIRALSAEGDKYLAKTVGGQEIIIPVSVVDSATVLYDPRIKKLSLKTALSAVLFFTIGLVYGRTR